MEMKFLTQTPYERWIFFWLVKYEIGGDMNIVNGNKFSAGRILFSFFFFSIWTEQGEGSPFSQ